MLIRASIEPLCWESEFFQLRSARLNFSSTAPLINPADLSHWALVQAKVPGDRLDVVDALGHFDFRLAACEVDFFLMTGTKNVDLVPSGNQWIDNHWADNNNGNTVRQATEKDIPLLRSYAASLSMLSRFRPPWYRQQESSQFYATWVEKAVLGTFDHQCLLVINDQGQPEGFVTLRDITQGEARIGLLAVFPAAQGKGVGKKLMLAAKQWCQQRQLHLLRIATQPGNIAALRLYISSGAVVVSTAYWLYR